MARKTSACPKDTKRDVGSNIFVATRQADCTSTIIGQCSYCHTPLKDPVATIPATRHCVGTIVGYVYSAQQCFNSAQATWRFIRVLHYNMSMAGARKNRCAASSYFARSIGLWQLISREQVKTQASGLEANCVYLLIRPLLAACTWLMPVAIVFSWPHDSVGDLLSSRRGRSPDMRRFFYKMLRSHLIYAKYKAVRNRPVVCMRNILGYCWSK